MMLTIGTSHEERFRAAYRRHAPAVWRYLARRLGDDVLAEDLTSEVFVVAWRRRHEAPTDSLPWLYGVARRVLANDRRAARADAARKIVAAPDAPRSSEARCVRARGPRGRRRARRRASRRPRRQRGDGASRGALGRAAARRPGAVDRGRDARLPQRAAPRRGAVPDRDVERRRRTAADPGDARRARRPARSLRRQA